MWSDKVGSHHESYLLQRTCIQPEAQYALRSIIQDIPRDFLEEWDQRIAENYPGYIQKIPVEYRLQQISEGGLQLTPVSFIRTAASTAFKASNNPEMLDDATRACIQETAGIAKGEGLQQTITKYLGWYALQLRQAFERTGNSPPKGKQPRT